MSRPAQHRIADNPFYVLDLPADASRVEMERQGQKLLAMLELDIAAARSFDTPLGPRPRTPEAVREAMSELRDPKKRLHHEIWAHLGAGQLAVDGGDDDDAPAPGGPWESAMRAFGWSRR